MSDQNHGSEPDLDTYIRYLNVTGPLREQTRCPACYLRRQNRKQRRDNTNHIR